ncbi:HAMP domain-containing protein [Thalassomonas viridans]|uniref:histidine kinase n=1 Tax=Thalassomonas viridans TaxID=137584 RepID=A0AAE9Z2R5_9GAMM|nr:ATP-binding protein [Thalassomonas viridans]WDE04985.1 HAMP domain-containing protein [Thalassomonas viridans]
MIKQLRAVLSSIKVKLFCWFWLVTILSILTTRFIITQLSNDILALPPHEGDIGYLHGVNRRLARAQPDDMQTFLETFHRRGRNKMKRAFAIPPQLWIKEQASGKVFSRFENEFPRLKDYLAGNNFTELRTYQFPRLRLTGPLVVTLHNQEYQFFVALQENRKHFAMLFFSQLPPWARIALPLGISFIFCWLLARNLSKPLSSMRTVANRLGDGDLSVRVNDAANRSDELGSLARSFNQMAQKLELSLQAQKRLLGDVSHELRSPMTRLQIALGLAQKSAKDPQNLAKHLQRCETEVHRLDQMIADVLALSRLENALHNLHFSKVDLAGLLDILIQDAQFTADEKSIKVIITSMENCQLRADSQLIASAVNNVLGNAVKYSPQGSRIEVALKHRGNNCLLSIADAGPGVPRHTLEQLFEPFYRVTEARDRQTGGTGLGLAIAKQAVLAHQGNITAHNNDSGGLTVTIQLPLDNFQPEQPVAG